MSDEKPKQDPTLNPAFAEADLEFWEHKIPWPQAGQNLLEDATGSEPYIYPYDRWFTDDASLLGMYAHLYTERARDLVRTWKATHDKPENFIYPVGFLYRHAVELKLKAEIAGSPWFARLDAKERRNAIYGHDLSKLWKVLKPLVSIYMSSEEVQAFEKLLLQLHELDSGSDGFRYPFFDDRQGNRTILLGGLPWKSFQNFIHVIEGMLVWLSCVADEDERYTEYIREMDRDAGYEG